MADLQASDSRKQRKDHEDEMDQKKRRGVQGELSGFKDYSERVGVKVLPAALSPFSRPEPAATGSGEQFFTSGPNGSVTDSDNCSGLG